MHSSYFLHDRVLKYWSIEFFILANMGSNQAPSFKKMFYPVKIKSLEVASLQELAQRMDQLQRQAFRKTWKNLEFGYDRSVYWIHCIPRSILRPATTVLHIWGLSVNTNHRRVWRDIGMPARRKEVVSIFWVIPFHGKNSQSGQGPGARIGLSETRQK